MIPFQDSQARSLMPVPLLESEDSILVRLARGGDEAAFGELYRRHSRMMAKIIYGFVKNADDVDDLVQDTFIRAFQHLNDFDGRAKFSTWLTRIAINTSLMLLRKRRIRSECSIDRKWHDEDDSSNFLQIADPAPNAEDICVHYNSIAEVRQAVKRLPRLLQEPTALRCSEDIHTKDVATLLGISVSATKSRMLRATNKLRLMMGANVQYKGAWRTQLKGHSGRPKSRAAITTPLIRKEMPKSQ